MSKGPKNSSKMWTVMSLASGLAAAALVRKALNGGWKAATGKEPPANPADPDVQLREAVAWATVSGTAIALARMYAGRRAARYYKKSTGHLPPELQSDAVREARAAATQAQEDAEQAARKSGKGGKRARKKSKK
ncbi:MAG: DUF4235 domain-containing protein [Actinomycetota bacterium]|nr:DUF4235 domain-containing protein [Actinomycetota bacterium]